MNLIEKKLDGGLVLALPYQAQPLLKEIWDHQVYNQTYSIRPGDIVFDVGANVGIFSIYAATQGAKVFCFEPNPEIFPVLQRNIRANGLADRISAFDIALGAKNGVADLFVANSGDIYAEGSASIRKDYVDDLGKKVGESFTMYRVTCSKLDYILEQLSIQSVDFMKMDCEGAEYEILDSTSAASLQKIQRIAMEIHGACYSQKDFCRLLHQKGFIIDRLVKATRPWMTGYLDCSSVNMQAVSNDMGRPALPPAAIFSVSFLPAKPEIVSASLTNIGEGIANAGAIVTLDGSQSFVPNHPGVEPVFSWRIDGREIPDDSSKALVTYQFNEPGYHTVALEVRHEAETDVCEQPLTILTPGYFPEKIDYSFAGMNDDSGMSPAMVVPLDTVKVFSIQSEVLPPEGFGSIFLGVEVIAKQPVFNGMYSPWLLFEYNGRKIIINNSYEEIRLDNIRFDCDVFFTIRPYFDNINAEIHIRWGIPETASEVRDGNSAMILSALGQADLYRFEGAKPFIISKDSFPVDWTPKNLVVGLQPALTSDLNSGQKIPLDGALVYKNTETPISGWRSEVRFTGVDFEQDLHFTVQLPKANCIRVTWWGE